MKKFLFVFLLSFPGIILSQGLQLDWALAYRSAAATGTKDCATDKNDNMYIIGNFAGPSDFDPGAGTYTINSTNGSNYALKLDSSGNFVWAIQFGGSNFLDINAVAVDDSEYVYIAGRYDGTHDFDPDTGTYYMTSSGNLFILKLSPQGKLTWVMGLGNGHESCSDIAVDDTGNIYVTGYFKDTVDFDPTFDSTFLYGEPVWKDVFVAKYKSSGHLIWAKALNGYGDDISASIALDKNGDVYVGGNFEDTLDANPDPFNSHNLVSNGFLDMFIVKLDNKGDFLWAENIGGSYNEAALDIHIDDSLYIYTAGYFQSTTVDFDPDPTGQYNLSAYGSEDGYISKWDSLGNFIWTKNFSGSSQERITSMDTDDDGNVYASGFFLGEVDFDPDSVNEFTLSSSNSSSTDAFFVKINANGEFLTAKSIGANKDDLGVRIFVNSKNTPFFCGIAKDTVDLNFGTGVYHIPNFYYLAPYSFILKLNQCNFFQTNLVDSVCDSLLSPSGRYTWYNTGNYTDRFNTLNGCDSLIHIQLNVDSMPPDPIPYSAYVCDSGATSLAVLSPNTTPYWYDSINSVIPFDTGWVVNSPFVNTTTILFVQAVRGTCETDKIPALLEVRHSDTLSYHITSCVKYIDPVKGLNVRESGTYIGHYYKTNSCDSIETYYVTIKEVNTDVTRSGNTLISHATKASYQWLECDNGYHLLTGDTLTSFTPLTIGRYAVAVFQNDCRDTSACYLVDPTGISENDFRKSISIYPNPGTGTYYIDFDSEENEHQLIIRDISGKIISEIIFPPTKEQEFTIDGKAGIYFIEVVKGDRKQVFKLIKN